MDSAVGKFHLVICFKPAFYPPLPQKKEDQIWACLTETHLSRHEYTSTYISNLSINIIYIYISYINWVWIQYSRVETSHKRWHTRSQYCYSKWILVNIISIVYTTEFWLSRLLSPRLLLTLSISVNN